MNNKEAGIRSLRKRLVGGIRDTVLTVINSPEKTSSITGEPNELNNLSPDKRKAIVSVIARALDKGVEHFLYGMDDKADGFEIRFSETLLNEEGSYNLTDSSLPEFAEDSEFDRDGCRKQ